MLPASVAWNKERQVSAAWGVVGYEGEHVQTVCRPVLSNFPTLSLSPVSYIYFLAFTNEKINHQRLHG